MTPLSIAIVGCGRMGTERAVAAHKLGARIACFCDSDLSRAQALAGRFSGGSAAVNLEALDWRSLDAAFVCTPPSFRGPVELISLNNGVPFFVEKPIGLHAEQMRPLIDQLRNSRTIHAVGYMNRYRNSIRLARTLVRGRNVLGVTCAWLVREYRVPWWTNKSFSGGPFNEQATHVVDLYRCLVGEIPSVISIALPEANATGPERQVAVALSFSTGALGTLLYSCEAREKAIHLSIFCEDGALHFEGWDFRMTVNTINGALPEEETDGIFVKETKAFLEAVRNGDQSMIECDLADAYETQKVVDTIRKSFEPPTCARV